MFFKKPQITAVNTSILFAYLVLCFLMVRIVMQYMSPGTDNAFLAIKQEYIDIPYYLPAFYIHVFTAIIVLPAGFTQFSGYLLKYFPSFHRINGRIYVLVVLFLAAPSGLIIGMYANGGAISRVSFCLLAILWAWFTTMAWRMAVRKQFKKHKAFIYRSFSLTLSAITLRAWKYLLVVTFHPRPMDTYRIVAWLGWTLNLLIAELLIYKQSSK